MERNTNSNQAACCDTPGNLLHTMKGPKLDTESSHCVDDKQEISQDSEAVSEKIDSNMVPIKLDTQAVNVLNGEYCGLFTQLSIDYVDIFEILREEIIAAEARELEVDGLLNAGEEELEESPGVEGLESTFVRDSKVTGIDRDDCQGEAQIYSFHNEATDVADAALILQKGDDEQAELPRSRSAEDAFLKEVEEMGAEDEAVPSEDNGAGFEDRLKWADVRETGLAEDRRVAEFEHVESSTSPREEGFEQAHQNNDKVDHNETLPTSNVQVNGDIFSKEDEAAGTDKGKETLLDSRKGDDGDHLLQNDMSDKVSEQAHQNNDKVDHDETLPASNVQVNGDIFSKEDEGAGTGKGDDGDHLLQNDMSDKVSEHSEDDDYTSSPFSGPIAFSGMLSYSGMISYSGQIPYSGNMSLHSDSSTSTRSFAFPILASDWNSSPAKIGQPDSRYFRRRRRWRPRFCCRRPATLFD